MLVCLLGNKTGFKVHVHFGNLLGATAASNICTQLIKETVIQTEYQVLSTLVQIIEHTVTVTKYTEYIETELTLTMYEEEEAEETTTEALGFEAVEEFVTEEELQ